MKSKIFSFCGFLALIGLIAACGAAKEKVEEVKNSIDVKGYWLMTESQHSSKVEKAMERESMVLAFKDGKASFSPTNSLRGHVVYSLLSACTAGPRPYRTEKNQFVFEPVVGCDEKRIVIQTLNDTTFKFADPDNADIIRTFVRIDEAKYQELVKTSDRRS